ncbi:MAG: hypothetical protein M0P43_07795 [Arcobacteraceae bacterium]|nr:hypothetical protein [Arcobacteraceae bacterium]
MSKKRCDEEFNPWPPFVDIFSSVILVMLLFLLITIVNIAYYAQFKFKVSYTGTVATDEIILKPQENKEEIIVKQKQQDVIEDLETEEDIGDIESAGKDLSRIYEDEVTKQETFVSEDYMILNFGSSDIKIDNPTILKIKEFINDIKQKNPRHVVKISAVDPKNQISATVMKQISLARTINTRNLIRQLGYDIKDVQIDLLKLNLTGIDNTNDNGYIIVRIEKK